MIACPSSLEDEFPSGLSAPVEFGREVRRVLTFPASGWNRPACAQEAIERQLRSDVGSLCTSWSSQISLGPPEVPSRAHGREALRSLVVFPSAPASPKTSK